MPQREEILNEVVETISEGVYFMDISGRASAFGTRAAERITGYSRDEILGKRCSDDDPPACRRTKAANSASNGCPLVTTMADGLPQEMEAYAPPQGRPPRARLRPADAPLRPGQEGRRRRRGLLGPLRAIEPPGRAGRPQEGSPHRRDDRPGESALRRDQHRGGAPGTRKPRARASAYSCSTSTISRT